MEKREVMAKPVRLQHPAPKEPTVIVLDPIIFQTAKTLRARTLSVVRGGSVKGRDPYRKEEVS